MANAQQKNPANSPRGTKSPDIIEKSPVEARQGYRGVTVLYVLILSLFLAFFAYLGLHFYFVGAVL